MASKPACIARDQKYDVQRPNRNVLELAPVAQSGKKQILDDCMDAGKTLTDYMDTSAVTNHIHVMALLWHYL